MSLDMLSEMIESYRAGDLDLVEDLYTEGEELIEREGPFYHNTQGRFSSAASASSLSMGDNGPKYKMSGGKRKGQVKVCGRLARRSRTNKLCSTGKFPSYYKGGKGRGQRARGAAPSVAAEPAAGGKKKGRSRVLRRANASAAKRALRSRGHDLGGKSDKALKRAVGQLVKGLNRARGEAGKEKYRAALDVLQPEFEARGMPNFIEKSSKLMATRIQQGTSRLRKAPVRKEKDAEVAAEDYDYYGESLEDDAVDLLSDIFDDGEE